MNTDNSWAPGHATNKGYPFNEIVSKVIFTKRPKVHLDLEKNKVFIDTEAGQYEETIRAKEVAALFYDWNNALEPDNNPDKVVFSLYDEFRATLPQTDFEDFLMFRLAEFAEALEIAEGQLQDLLTEDPFNPEMFGFDLVMKNKSITEAPLRIYLSKYDNNITLFRKPGTPNDKNWNPAIWTLMTKKGDSFTELDLNLPCHRIAYAAFYALGVKVEEFIQTRPIKEDFEKIAFATPDKADNEKLSDGTTPN